MSSINDQYQEMTYYSSQESLPLSQETFQTLVNNILGKETESFNNATDLTRKFEDSLFSTNQPELVQFVSNQVPYAAPHIPMMQASVPAVSDWAGEYQFNVFFNEKEPLSKKVIWTYSTTHNRLYVKRDKLCPFNFSTNCRMGVGFYLRAMLVYSDAQYSNEVVKKCLYHSKQELLGGIFEAEHLIRSGSSEASYLEDKVSHRHSVCVPFEDPTVGQDFSSYLFQFLCYNSCVGGPNRKQMTLIFTLEKLNHLTDFEVVGRKCFGLKVCACPGRDRATDEGLILATKAPETPIGPPPKKKFKENHVVPANNSSSFKKPREYTIKVKDEESYKFLSEMKKVTNVGTRIFLMHMKNCRELYRKSKEQHNFYTCLNAYVNYVSSTSDDNSEH